MDNLRLEIEWDVDNEQLQNDINQSKKNIEGVGQTIDQVQKKVHEGLAGLLSDSAAEIEQYKKSLVGLSELKAPSNVLGMDDLSNRLNEIGKAKNKLVDFYLAGRVSAQDYEVTLASLVTTEKQLAKEIAERTNYTPATTANTEVQLTKEQQLLKAVADEYKGIVKESSAVYDQLPTKIQNAVTSLIRQKEELSHVRDAMLNVQSAYAAGELSSTQHEQALARLIVLESQLSAEIKATADTARRGFEEQNISTTKHEGLLQRMQREAALYQKGMLEATRADNLEKYRAKLEGVNAEMSKLTKGTNIGGGSGWNGLQNSINQLSRELPAFTYSAQTGFMAISNNIPILIDEINRLRVANEALNASGQKGVPVWKQVLSGLFSWQTAMGVGILLMTTYGKEISEWVKALFKGKEALDTSRKSIELLNSVRKDSIKVASSEIASLKMLNAVATDNTRSMDERRRAAVKIQDLAKTYNKNISTETILIGNLKKEYVQLTEAIIASAKSKAAEKKIQENAEGRLEIEFEIEAIREANKARKEAIKLEGDKRSVIHRGTAMDDGGQIEIIVETVEERQKASDRYTENEVNNAKKRLNAYDKEDEFLQKFIQVPKEVKKIKTPSAESLAKAYDEMLKVSKEGLAKIKDLDLEYSILNLSDDEKEKEALRKKFADFRKIIEEENEKIRKYNEKNKANVALIDISQVAPIEQRAESQLLYKQDTNALNKEIEEQKKIFEAYENYKAKLGKSAADERFKDDLKGFENYSQYLDSVIAKESEAFTAVDNKTATAGQEARVNGLKKESEEAIKIEKQKYIDVLALMISYDQERKNVLERQSEERKQVEATATAEGLAEMDRRHREELNQLDDTNIEKLAEVKHLFEGIDKMTDAGARTLIAKINALLSSDADISPELREKISKSLKEVTESLDERLPERTLQIADGFAQMAQNLSPVNEGLASMLGGLSNVLRATVQVNNGIKGLNKGITNYKANKEAGGGGLLGSLGAIAGVAGPVGQIVGAVSSVVGGVVSFFKASKESARKAAEEIKAYQDSVLSGEYEYNRLLRERAREQQNINDLTNEQLKLQQQLLSLQGNASKNDYEDLLKRLQNEGEQIIGQRTEKYGGFLGIGKKTRVVDITAGVNRYTYEQLEELNTSNKLTESTKKLFEELKKAKEELEKINKEGSELQKELLDRMSGNATSSAISNSIISGFKQGRRAVIDFADDAEEIIQNALLSAMNYTVLDAPLQELIKKFREDAKDGLTEKEISEFKKGYNNIVEKGLEAIKEIEKVTGQTIGGSKSGSLSSSGIERITEQSATEWIGIGRAHIDVSKQHLTVSKAALEIWQNSYTAIVQMIKHQAAIEANTAETVSQLKLVVGELKMVNKNTGVRYGG